MFSSASSISGPTIASTSSFHGPGQPRARNSSAPPLESLSRFTPLTVNQAYSQRGAKAPLTFIAARLPDLREGCRSDYQFAERRPSSVALAVLSLITSSQAARARFTGTSYVDRTGTIVDRLRERRCNRLVPKTQSNLDVSWPRNKKTGWCSRQLLKQPPPNSMGSMAATSAATYASCDCQRIATTRNWYAISYMPQTTSAFMVNNGRGSSGRAAATNRFKSTDIIHPPHLQSPAVRVRARPARGSLRSAESGPRRCLSLVGGPRLRVLSGAV